MTTFVDTSALYALLGRDDVYHDAALGWLEGARGTMESLLTHNYVVVESASLIHRRLGPEAVRILLEDILAPLPVVFVDEQLHRLATSAFLAAVRRRPSLVDWVSFELMRREGIRRAFAFDRDFHAQGFETIP
ncbi:MAG TPA: PIN domain-containing protein [Actinomycetota bacterium]|nr:PIN domain-containing protein [Actinomycetota bacterium]